MTVRPWVDTVRNTSAASALRNCETDTMTTIEILHCKDSTYTVTVNGKVVAAGLLTNAAAWREAERLVESDTADLAVPADAVTERDHLTGQVLPSRQSDRSLRHARPGASSP